MKSKLKYKIVNYFGDYGTANFWSNITNAEIETDFAFIKKKGLNTIMLMIPFSSFCGKTEGDFQSKYTETLTFIMSCAKQYGLMVVARIGYLWESNFDDDRTLEQYTDIYEKFLEGGKSRFEDNFIAYVRHFCDNYEFEHIVLSWEDFFWPINFHNLTRDNDNQLNERETIRLMEHLLNQIGQKEHLFVEQRTNGEFEPIKYNPTASYAYYNTYNIESWDDHTINNSCGHQAPISSSMVIEKHFIEWLSRMKDILSLSNERRLIIDQFNIIDNTFSDDEDMQVFNKSKSKLFCDITNLKEIMDFLTPIIRQTIEGIGFWSLWTTCAGHIYNGTFKFGMEGWESDGSLSEHGLVLAKTDKLSTNLGYVRIDGEKGWNIIIKYSCTNKSQILLRFNNQVELVELPAGNNQSFTKKYSSISNRDFVLELLSETMIVHRIDCYNIMHKSFLFDIDRNPACDETILQNLVC